MAGQTKTEKQNIKLRYAASLYKAFKKSGFRSYRKLADSGDLEPSHIQKIAVGRVDVSLTINIAIAKALGISYSELAAYYDGITDKDMEEFLNYMAEQKKIRGKKSKK